MKYGFSLIYTSTFMLVHFATEFVYWYFTIPQIISKLEVVDKSTASSGIPIN